MGEGLHVHSDRPATVDLLSAVFRELRFESAAYRWLELGTDFSMTFDRPELRGVHIIARGECELAFPDGSTHRLRSGDLALLASGAVHELRSHGDEDVTVLCGAFLVGTPDHPVLRGFPQLILMSGEDGHLQPWLAPMVEGLTAEAREGGPGSDLVMARMSDALVLRALRDYGGAQRGWLAGLRDPYVASALAAMHADLARPWTLEQLAATAGLSRAAFAARFTQRVGEPAMGYLTALRIEHAKTLLRDERETVAAVAGRVGYRSDVGFTAAFKREVGVTPGAYARREAY